MFYLMHIIFEFIQTSKGKYQVVSCFYKSGDQKERPGAEEKRIGSYHYVAGTQSLGTR